MVGFFYSLDLDCMFSLCWHFILVLFTIITISVSNNNTNSMVLFINILN